MEGKKIKVARLRNRPYIVNYVNNGMVMPYQWGGSKGNNIDVKSIPEEVVNYLVMQTSCFKDGDLKIVDNEFEEVITDRDNYENNTHSKEEIEKILTGNFMKMKSELNNITVREEKQFVCDVAKEINLDSAGKRKFLAEWIGLSEDVIFNDD